MTKVDVCLQMLLRNNYITSLDVARECRTTTPSKIIQLTRVKLADNNIPLLSESVTNLEGTARWFEYWVDAKNYEKLCSMLEGK